MMQDGASMLKRIIILLGVLLFILMIIKSAGNFLVVDEPPVKSDVIIVLSGGEGRLEKGVSFYKEGFAPYLLLSNGSVDQLHERAIQLGVPTDSILLENQSTSTLENARFSKEVMQKYHFHSAIVVSSNSHMRRVKVLFDQTFKNSHIQLIYSSGVNPSYDPNRWWLSKEDRYTTFTEYIKLAGNILGFHGDQAKKFLEKFYRE